MKLSGFSQDAERFADLDKAATDKALAELEMVDALRYYARHGKYPQNLSSRAWRMMEKHGVCPTCGELVAIAGTTADGRLIGSCHDAFTVDAWIL